MTLAMRTLFPRLPRSQQYPLPPRQILTKVAGCAGVAHRLNDDHRRALARTGHFAFGTAMGALYGATVQPVLPGLLGGAAYSIAVWAGSYLGWLPAAGILPPATRMPRHRNALMVAAHIVWGACLGEILSAMKSSSRERARRA
jgi:uncharacterized membrane protein YagU involved in acid resistance